MQSWGFDVRRLRIRPTRDLRVTQPPLIAVHADPSRSFSGRRRGFSGRKDQFGFSLIELLVVLGIVVVLTSILMPGLRAVRETANKLACASNMRQMGYAITTYSSDNRDHLPYSYFGSAAVNQAFEMMAISTGGSTNTYDGLGRLLPKCGHYLSSSACLYCPSHHGEHPPERYESTLSDLSSNVRAYSNYNYRGDADPLSGKRYLMENDHAFVLLTDGLRTKSDFNHGNGLNLLHGDLAVSWYTDVQDSLLKSLPETMTDSSIPQRSS